jgi:hypothetical protein
MVLILYRRCRGICILFKVSKTENSIRRKFRVSATTSLDRARKFLAAKAAKLALTVVPLAALSVAALPAFGSLVFGSCSVSGTGTTGSCTITQAAATGSDTNLNALQLAGSAATSGGSITMGVTNATGSGTYSGIVPVSWYFEIIDPGLDTINWQITAEIIGNSGSTTITPNGSVTSTGWITGNSSLDLTDGASTSIKNYDLSVVFHDISQPSSGSFSVSIPAGSTIDLNTTTTAGPASTPEPATLLLTGGGLASVAVLRRRRKKT